MADFTFDEIPTDWRSPGTYLEVKPNYRNVGIFDYPVQNLIIGAKLDTGSLQPGTIVEVVRGTEGQALFGIGSIGAEQIAAFRKANKTQALFVMAVADDAGAVKATGTFTFTGAVSSSLVLRFKVAGQQVRFTAQPTSTVAQLAASLAAAINDNASLPVTATAAAGVVTVKSRHGGEVGNDIDLRVDVEAQPLPASLNVAVAAMAGGTGNPDLTPALDVIANTWYTAIQHPFTDATNMGIFAEFLTNRFTAMSKLDAHGYVGKRGSFNDLGTWGQLTNCPFLTAVGLKASPTSSWVISAAIMGLASFHLANDPARQLRSLVVPGVEAPAAADQFIETERDLLLRRGVSTFESLSDGAVTISRLITTYKKSNLNVDDEAWLDIMVPATLSRIRYDWQSYVSLLYPRAKLTDDDGSAAFASNASDNDTVGSSVVTARRMLASWAGRCREYANRVWIEAVEDTIKQSVFQRSSSDKNRLESRQQIKIVGNLMVLAGSLEFQV
ncbi:phage tail protein [Ochrobactrum pseudogrignonense]|uniref:Phage tail protein n=1 Tax=Brucella pseudogrignonensis TaxID=419475 RepID=A0A7Y3WWU9_9HYPH|nr:phage tail protein [Brucella pseudogrignonensis]NNV20652.1 phage tail protein [Brucella pseudogrignonensis]